MNRSTPRVPKSEAPSTERGSAYLFVLLALLVLTAIGLSLVVVTQTEAQIGGAEKSATRVLYGAESGLQIEIALGMAGLGRSRAVSVASTTVLGSQNWQQTDLSAFFPVHDGPCPLCTQNMGGDEMVAIDYAFNAQDQRIGAGSAIAPQASKRLSQFLLTYPRQRLVVEESVRTFDPGVTTEDPRKPGLEMIKF